MRVWFLAWTACRVATWVSTLLLNGLGYHAKNLDGGYRTWHCSPAAVELQPIG